MDKKNRLTLVSLAADITVNVCLRSRASLKQTTAVVTKKKGTDKRHVELIYMLLIKSQYQKVGRT